MGTLLITKYKCVNMIPGYVDKLFNALFDCLGKWPTYKEASAANPQTNKPRLCSQYGDKPDLGATVAAHRSRYSVTSISSISSQ